MFYEFLNRPLEDGETFDIGHGIKVRSVLRKVNAYSDETTFVGELYQKGILTFGKEFSNKSNCRLIKTSDGRYAYFDMNLAMCDLFPNKGVNTLFEIKISVVEDYLNEAIEFLRDGYCYVEPKLAIVTHHNDTFIPEIIDDEDVEPRFSIRNDREKEIVEYQEYDIAYIMRNIGSLVNKFYKNDKTKQIGNDIINDIQAELERKSLNIIKYG